MGIYVGFDIGGTKCAAITGIENDGELTILGREAFATPADQQEALDRLCALAEKLAGGQEILGIGISSGGPMDADKGELCNPPNLPGWHGISLTDCAQQKLHALLHLAGGGGVDIVVQPHQLHGRAQHHGRLYLRFIIENQHAACQRLHRYLMHRARALQLRLHLRGQLGLLRNGGHIQAHAPRQAGAHLRHAAKRGELHQIVLLLFGQRRRSARSQRQPPDAVHQNPSLKSIVRIN